MAKKYYFIDEGFVIRIIAQRYRYISTFCKSAGITRQRFYHYIKKKHAVKETLTLQKIANALYAIYPEVGSVDYWKRAVWTDFEN